MKPTVFSHMSDPDFERLRRHARTRRMKAMLRYAPRRAALHRYPIIGRFAAIARRRYYLWSLRPQHVRPALYFGSIISLWPVMGVQLPLALLTAVFVRCNFMIIGGLQFITNPITAALIYFVTYRVGRYVLRLGGFSSNAPVVQNPDENVTIAITATEALPRQIEWSSAFGSTVMALFVGVTLCGLVLAVVLDLLYTAGWKWEHRARRQK
jgi:uncharacterized protein (DUF2062 family)